MSSWNETKPLEQSQADIKRRKNEHIEICMNEDVEGWGGGTGFDEYGFRHQALPELDFGAIDTACEFLGRNLKAPLMVSSMTGGTDEAARINVRLAEAAESRGWGMGLGSLRAAIECPETAHTFRVRSVAPSIPLIANLGAVQFNYGYGVDECRRAVDLTEADALVLHLNGLQELFQTGGDWNFSGLLNRIELLCRHAEFPIGVKEVGFGIDGDTARSLVDAGISFIDVAGAGGTSWIEVEKHRTSDPIRQAAAKAFEDWGTPTAQCVTEVRHALPNIALLASGGLVNGVEAAKAIALGANMASYGRALLAPAIESAEGLAELFGRIEFELRVAMFGIGAANLSQLRGTSRLASRRMT
ncbi:type 2 isopentenyl-diphosphate Delta-isomerase [Cohnella endophytica]|uniref:Isopentenyl-diphosphate delta-isomerase n=1 Tax=Cohnella endophytica TaxID=2419778 RepID=A0A494Y4I0_9BACL|nr:type 2 isopentenyl-diphosphate Delta-isomerase [Cohnella endophytica]RKP56950.1 type 2 isopentenyl-diphosphate Delta-isomerase [Cohnella endophytica]